jgi:DNA modification methylase
LVFPGHGNLPVWWEIARPGHVGCWYKPGNPAGGGLVQFCEWEPWLLWGKRMALSNVVRATITRQRDTGDHPCPKPVLLFTELLKRAKATSVLEPFVGSGTTLVAAQRLGITAIGIELEERYCEIAAKRLSQEVLPLEQPA